MGLQNSRIKNTKHLKCDRDVPNKLKDTKGIWLVSALSFSFSLSFFVMHWSQKTNKTKQKTTQLPCIFIWSEVCWQQATPCGQRWEKQLAVARLSLPSGKPLIAFTLLSYSAVKKCSPPSWCHLLLYICHTQMFQVIKAISILDKGRQVNTKCSFKIKFIEGKKLYNLTWTYVKEKLPPQFLNQPVA